jgi:hypothetical protein
MCQSFGDAYWRRIDQERFCPTEFVDQMTEWG